MDPITINPQEAADALKQADAAERRSARAYVYQRFAPYLLLWGLIWVAGYGATDLVPRVAGWIWLGLVLVALSVSMAIGRRAEPGRLGPKSNWRYSLFFVAVWAFFASTYAVMAPVSGMQQGAFPPLVVAFIYILLGLWTGPRLVIAGLVVGALTLGGFFYLPQHFLLWEGFVGGGALILAGLWFRRV
ncbi:MAG TPA: hypothetical protein VK515_01290 [Rhizomicrobium sp.]|nr:hypothetical protein [Rhizomicrobium sp.]